MKKRLFYPDITFPCTYYFVLFLSCIFIFYSPLLQAASLTPQTKTTSRTVSPSQTTPPNLLQSLSTPAKAYGPELKIWEDAQEVNVRKMQLRKIRLKEGTGVPPSQFFEVYRNSLGLRDDDQMVESRTLNLPQQWRLTHYTQLYKSLPVFEASFRILTVNGESRLADGNLGIDINVDPNPQISEAEALNIALNDLGITTLAWQENPERYSEPQARLGITSQDYSGKANSFKLVYRFWIPAYPSPAVYRIDVNAKTGEVIRKINVRREIDAACSGPTEYYGPQQFICDENTQSQNPDFTFCLKMQGSPKITIYENPDPIVDKEYLFNNKFYEVCHPTANFEEEQKGASSLQWNFQMVFDFLLNRFGWSGLDGKGQPKIEVLGCQGAEGCPSASFGPAQGADPAFFYFRTSPNIGKNSITLGPEVGIDVIGHETSHGVMDYMTMGNQKYSGESGALNEGFGDIFGVLVEREVKGYESDWWCFAKEILATPNSPYACLRNFQDPKNPQVPSQNPDTYAGEFWYTTEGNCTEDNDYCGVHRNTGVLGKWFYLLVEGGQGTNDHQKTYQVAGIGFEKVIPIIFYTMTLLHPTSDYADARIASQLATEAIYGPESPEYQSVENAWGAVGVGESYRPPRQTTPANGTIDLEPWPRKLTWSAYPDEVEWQIQVSKGSFFNRDTLKKNVAVMSSNTRGNTEAWAEFNLDADQPYFWRVRGRVGPPDTPTQAVGEAKPVSFNTSVNIFAGWFSKSQDPAPNPSGQGSDGGEINVENLDKDWGSWSPVYSFVTAPKKIKTLNPGIGSGVDPWNTTFQWEAVPGAESYQFLISTNKEESAGAIPVPAGTEYKPILKVDTDYYWRVRSMGPDGAAGSWSQSEGQHLKTDRPQTTLTSPDPNAAVSPWAVPLKWNKVPGAVDYQVVVAKDQSLTQVLVNEWAGNSIVATVALPDADPGEHWWAVRPKGPEPYNEFGAYGIRNFQVDLSQLKTELLYPLDQVQYGLKNAFGWKEIPGALSYTFQHYQYLNGTPGALVNSFEVPFQSANPGQLYWAPTNDTYSTGAEGYCWAIVANGPNNMSGPPSEIGCYKIGPPAPQLVQPANNITNQSYQPTHFTWTQPHEDLYPISHYKIQVKAGSSQAGYSSTTNKFQHFTLQPNTFYNWNVEAVGTNGLSTISTFHNFTTQAEEQEPDDNPGPGSGGSGGGGPAQPQIVCPLGDSQGTYTYFGTQSPSYKLKWSSVSGAGSYKVRIFWYPNPGVDPSNFQKVFEKNYPASATSTEAIPHNSGNAFRWDIQAFDSNNQGSPVASSQYYAPAYSSGYQATMGCAP